MRVAAASLCLGLLSFVGPITGPAHADERWPEAACQDIQELEEFYSRSAPDLTSKAWTVRPLLVLLRDHCGVEVTMKIEESDKVVKRRLWPTKVCSALGSSKRLQSMFAAPLDKHCSQNSKG